MELILIRHADAEREASSDFERELTDKGRKQSKRVGRFLAGAEVRPDAILTSPLVRARQSAELVADELGCKSAVEDDQRLASGMAPKDAFAVLRDHEEDACVALVGHEPDFSELAGALAGMNDPACIEVKKASCLLFEVERPVAGGGVLRWLVPVKQM